MAAAAASSRPSSGRPSAPAAAAKLLLGALLCAAAVALARADDWRTGRSTFYGHVRRAQQPPLQCWGVVTCAYRTHLCMHGSA